MNEPLLIKEFLLYNINTPLLGIDKNVKFKLWRLNLK